MRLPSSVSIALLSVALGLPAAAQAQAASSPAKKELVNKVLQLQQPAIEALARNLAEQPAAAIAQQAGQIIRTRVPADKREAVGAAVQADVNKYVEEAVPLARASAIKLAPSTVGAVMEEKLTEDELKQVIAILESPAFAKFRRLEPELQSALLNKLVAETRPAVEPKIRALDLSVARRLGIDTSGAPAGAASGARAPARAASN